MAPDPGVGTIGHPTNKLYGPESLSFFNNILVATDSGRGFTCEPDCHDNLFSGIPAAGSDATVAEPGFVGVGPYDSSTPPKDFKLRSSSPAYRTGAAIPASATRDFFGTPIGSKGAPSIGFWQGAAAAVRIEQVRQRVGVPRGSFRRISVLVRNGGDAAANGLSLCVVRSGATRRKLASSRCAERPTLGAGAAEEMAVRIRARRNRRARGPAPVQLQLRSDDAGSDSAELRVRVKR